MLDVERANNLSTLLVWFNFYTKIRLKNAIETLVFKGLNYNP